MLDNFETNLKPQAEPGTTAELLWACQDPAWDRCLARLATELVGTRSRVLITCRRPLAALAGTASHWCGSARCRRARRRSTCGSTRAWARWSSAGMRRKRPLPCGCWKPAASTRCSWTAWPGWQPAARRCYLN